MIFSSRRLDQNPKNSDPAEYFFGGLECFGHSFAYVAQFVFLRDVLIWPQRAAVASRRSTNLATHLPTKNSFLFPSSPSGSPILYMMKNVGGPIVVYDSALLTHIYWALWSFFFLLMHFLFRPECSELAARVRWPVIFVLSANILMYYVWRGNFV
jgi:hypothetical protein